MEKLTQARLKTLLRYNKRTGLFFWKNPAGRVKPGTQVVCTDSNGYIMVRLDGRLYRAHRLAWLWVHGVFPKLIDHKNRIKSDNRIANLRECSQHENVINRSLCKSNKTGYKGVSFDKQKKLYRACSSYKRQHIFLGYFKSPEEAYKMYLEHVKNRPKEWL